MSLVQSVHSPASPIRSSAQTLWQLPRPCCKAAATLSTGSLGWLQLPSQVAHAREASSPGLHISQSSRACPLMPCRVSALPAVAPFLGGGEQLFREAALGQREHRQQRLRGVPRLLLPACTACRRVPDQNESELQVRVRVRESSSPAAHGWQCASLPAAAACCP